MDAIVEKYLWQARELRAAQQAQPEIIVLKPPSIGPRLRLQD